MVSRPNVIRISPGGCTGWLVRIQHKGERRVNKFFSFGTHGGAKEALRKAEKLRRRIRREIAQGT